MTGESIQAQLEALTLVAKARMNEGNPDIGLIFGRSEIDFMTSDEKALRQSLILSLPSYAQLRAEARERIVERIKSRRRNLVMSN
jgi:hypothetical protein